MSGKSDMDKGVLNELVSYAAKHEDYSDDDFIIRNANQRLWAGEAKRKDKINLDLTNEEKDTFRKANRHIQKMTGFEPVSIPRIKAAMEDEKFIRSILMHKCSFIAFDDPEGSIKLVKGYMTVLKLGMELGVQAHYQKINKKRLEKGRKKRQCNKTEFVTKLIDKIQALEHEQLSRQQIADRLNEEGTPTPSGKGKWHINTVQRVIKGIAKDEAKGVVEDKAIYSLSPA